MKSSDAGETWTLANTGLTKSVCTLPDHRPARSGYPLRRDRYQRGEKHGWGQQLERGPARSNEPFLYIHHRDRPAGTFHVVCGYVWRPVVQEQRRRRSLERSTIGDPGDTVEQGGGGVQLQAGLLDL